MSRIYSVIGVLCVISTISCPAFGDVIKKSAPTAQPKSTVTVSNQQRELNMLYATGEGAMPNTKEQPNRAKAYLQAKVYAKNDAIASLAQAIKGTIIDYSSNGKGYVADTTIKQEVKAVLDSVQVVSAKKRLEGKDVIVEVTVRAPKPVLPKVAPIDKQVKPSKDPAKFCPTWVYTALPDNLSKGEYTSLIIDARGLGIQRCMSPKVFRQDGSEVWGTMKTDCDFLEEHGVVAYACTTAEAFANKRAGVRPLVVRASGRGSSTSRGDVVLSASDSDAILTEDRRSGFFADFRVVFVIDPAEKRAARR